MGRTYSQCLLKQEDGMSLPLIVQYEMSSKSKHNKVCCQVVATSASTKHVLPFASCEVNSSEVKRKALAVHPLSLLSRQIEPARAPKEHFTNTES